MNVKTINLTGSEVAVNVGGGNSEIKNNGTDTIYASASNGIVAGADGVVSIPAGASVTVTDTRGTVYILGTGSVEVVGKDFVAPVFKSAATSGGGGTEDEVARNAISAHTGNAEIHVTAAEKANWNAVNYSNPNLLINPDFAINQRGKNSYNITGYTADCWFAQEYFVVTPLEFGIRITPAQNITSNLFCLFQNTPISAAMRGKDYTLSVNVTQTNDYAHAIIIAYGSSGNIIKSSDKIKLQTGFNSVTIRNIPNNTAYIRSQFTINSGAQPGDVLEMMWAKLELGSVATPYELPNPADELAHCQRYYQLRSTGDIAAVDMRPVMATITDIKQREDGLYEYIAKL